MTLRVFLGNAPWKKPGFYGVRAGSRWPHFESDQSEYMPFPFFMAYASALLRREGFDVRIVDAIAEGMDDHSFLSNIENYCPDILVFEVSTISIKTDLALAKKAREIIPKETLIIFCGLHTEMNRPDFLENQSQIDLVLIGEYEFTLLEVANTIKTGADLSVVRGILFRSADGNIFQSPPRDVVSDLDSFPWPDRDNLPMDKYCDTPGQIPKPSVQMWASRGCPFQCIFCAWPQIMYGGHLYRVRNPVDVVDEMEYLVRERQFASVYFDDDTFNIGKKRILTLCDEISKRKLNVKWAIMARADTMDEEMLIALKNAGMSALKYGVESADQSLVDRCGKGLDLEKLRTTVEITKKLGIFIHLTFTFGLPGENWTTIRKTIDLATELDPDSLQFSIITPFPGSLLYKELDQRGHLISHNWEEYDGYNTAVIRTDDLSKDDLEKALRMAHLAWEKHRFRKALRQKPWLAIKRALKNPRHALNRFGRVIFR